MVLEGMEKIKWSEKVTNEQVLDRMGEKKTLINNILRRKANWIGHILRRNCLLHYAIEGNERSRKKKNTAPRLFEKEETILGVTGGS